MTTKLANPLKIFGLWLLYMFVGVLAIVAASASADVGAGPDKNSPTKWPAKIVSALSGISFAVAGLGMWLQGDPTANQEIAGQLVMVGWPLGGLLSFSAWILIAQDLRS